MEESSVSRSGMYRHYKICSKWQNALKRLGCTNNNGVIDASKLNNKTVINYDEVKAWGNAFSRVMQNAIGRNLLKQHLVKEHADENMLFWEAVEAYKQLRVDEAAEMAKEIFDQFISSRAKKEISIDSQCRTALDTAVKQPNKNTFDEAQRQCFKAMETDNYERFKRSKIYINFLLQQIPHDVVVHWGDTFEKLLQYDEGRHLFEEFLVNEKAEENLRFWVEVQDYKKITNAKQRKARAIDIYNRFVNPDAKTEVSLDSATKNEIIKTYEKGDVKLFDKAEEHIFLLMRGDCYPRFVKSNQYRHFLEMHQKNNDEKNGDGPNAGDMHVEEQ